ncbi:aldehyde ferredoxin oxidoreductase family protein [Chloroflexota bacterium]
MTEWNGWAGTILDVNLTTGEIIKKPLPEDFAASYIGGSCFGARTLYDELEPGIDPLGPDNIIIVTNGPLVGTAAPACGRYEIVTKSPQTGIYLRSNGGGSFGPEMKWAGYDMIIVRGISEKSVYLWIKDDHVEIRDAGSMWGKDTWETNRMIRDEQGDLRVQSLKIGPSGENLGISSCVISDLSRAAGKGGVGAVWGSKKLKAIAVRGTKGVNIAKPDEFLELCATMQKRIMEDPTYELQSKYGTPRYAADPIISLGWLLAGGKEKNVLSSEFEKDTWDKNRACFSCPIHCSHWYSVKEGKYKGTEGEGMEANAIIYGAAILGVDSRAFICEYNNMCNKLGLHTDTPGCAIAWAMQLYKDGIITKEDTDGIELISGNEDAIMEMMHKIAYREGFGDILDGYPLKAAEKLGRGSDLYASHTKGMTGRGPGVEGSLEWTLALAVATRGRDHLTGAPNLSHIVDIEGWGEAAAKFGEKVYGESRLTTDSKYISPRKALLVYDRENIFAMCDSIGCCKFASENTAFTTGWHFPDFANALSLLTGMNFTTEGLLKAAESEMLLERAYNAREGIRRIDDYPMAFYWRLKHNEPHPKYDEAKLPFSLEIFDMALDEYYRLRGCDLETGIPTRERLEQVGLKDMADSLAKQGILPTTKPTADKG